MKYKHIVFLAFFLLLSSQPVYSQDHHYWGQQFGSRSALMGGAVIGGVRDTSAGFYNPGALGFVNEPMLSVSANGYQLERLSIEDGVGAGKSLDSDKINIVPLLASGTLIFESFPQHSFGYSVLARNKTAIDTSERIKKSVDVINDVQRQNGTVFYQGEEEYVGQMIASTELTELWGGLTWAYKIRPHIAIGATAFMAMRNQSQSFSANIRAMNGENLATVDKLDYLDFWNLRYLFKFGVAADFKALKLGMTITSPSGNLFGQGTVVGEEGFNNRYDPEQNKFVGEFVSNRQEDLDTTYNNPLSIALGFEYALTPKTNIAATMEWFNKQSQYDVITPGAHSFLRNIIVDEFIKFDETAEERSILKVKDGADSVVNFAVAIEHAFNTTRKGYISFRTDYENNPTNQKGRTLGMSNWDIYHLSVGATFRRQRSELAVGLIYSFGSQDEFLQFTNFADIGNNSLLGDPKFTSAEYSAFSLIIGYTYFFDINL